MSKSKNFTGLALVTVSTLNATKFNADKNDKMPVILTCLAGKIPNRNVISGTVAEGAGLEDGKTYLVQVTEREYNSEINPVTQKPYGRQFNYLKVATPSMFEIIEAQAKMPKAELFDVEAAVEVKEEAHTA